MRHKVFKLVNGKLVFKGIREIREGDIILEGETSMAETVNLKESKRIDVNREILAELSGKDKEDFDRGLHKLGMPDPTERDALIASLKRYHPEYTDRQIEIFCNPEHKW